MTRKPLMLLLGVLMLLGVGWQSDLLPRLIALEERVTSLEIVLMTPTAETLPDMPPTPAPNQIEALNLNSVNVRIRSTPSLTGAILSNISPQNSVILCLDPTIQANGLEWYRIASGGYVAGDFLQLTENRSYGVSCE